MSPVDWDRPIQSGYQAATEAEQQILQAMYESRPDLRPEERPQQAAAEVQAARDFNAFLESGGPDLPRPQADQYKAQQQAEREASREAHQRAVAEGRIHYYRPRGL